MTHTVSFDTDIELRCPEDVSNSPRAKVPSVWAPTRLAIEGNRYRCCHTFAGSSQYRAPMMTRSLHLLQPHRSRHLLNSLVQSECRKTLSAAPGRSLCSILRRSHKVAACATPSGQARPSKLREMRLWHHSRSASTTLTVSGVIQAAQRAPSKAPGRRLSQGSQQSRSFVLLSNTKILNRLLWRLTESGFLCTYPPVLTPNLP